MALPVIVILTVIKGLQLRERKLRLLCLLCN